MCCKRESHFFGGAMGVFTTQTLLGSVGVSKHEATLGAVAINWILKDGAGWVGKLLFSRQGKKIDYDLKQPLQNYGELGSSSSLKVGGMRSKLWAMVQIGFPYFHFTERRTSLQSFPLIICDPFAGFNLTFRMTRSGFLGLQDEAALTLGCIDKCRDGGFDEVFMTKIDFPAKYDYCVRNSS